MATRGGVAMTDLFLLSEAQMRRIEPYFPLSHGVPRVDARRVLSGIVFVIRNGLRWRDAPKAYPFSMWQSFAHPKVYGANMRIDTKPSHSSAQATIFCRKNMQGSRSRNSHVADHSPG